MPVQNRYVMPASRCQDADKDKVPVPDEEAFGRESRLAKLQAELEIQNEALSRQMSQNEEDMARRAQQMSSAMEKNLEMLRGSAERAAQQAHEVILRSAEEEMRRQLELKAEQREMRWRAEHRELELKAELNEMRLKASRKALQQLEESELLRDSTEGTLRCDLRSDLRSDRSMPRSHLRVKQACGRPAICIVLVVLAGGRSDGSSARQMHRLLRGSVQNEAI
eukprot:g21817.t1